MNNAIDITLENTGVVMEVENFDTENNTILVSLSKGGVDVDVDSVAPSITVDFGSLPQNVYWDEIQDKPDFHPVATSGDYDDLENKPDLHPVATSGDYDDLENKPNLSNVATSGNYGDLNGKPSINGVTLSGNKTTSDLGLASASQGALAESAYQKPSDGIPASDMTAAVQDSLRKADTALQQHQSLAGYATETWVEDQGYLTEHQDISGKADKSDTYTKQEVDAKMASAMHYKGSVANYDALLLIQDAEVGDMYNVLDTGHNYAWDGAAWDIQSGIVDLSGKQDTLVSGENIKTINGDSILGSGNIVIQGGGGTGDYEELDNLPSINNVELIGNKTAAQLGLQTELTIDAMPTEDSTNPVQSGGVFTALANLITNGCLFGGEVSPQEQIPHGNDHGYFYLAIKDGIYTNFSSSIELTNCIAIIFWDTNTQNWGFLDINYNLDYVDNRLNGKQDTISDLSTIRSGAALGATAIQSSEKGAASGVATLDSGGKVPQSQLPSYVDDVLEYANLASFPATGESGKIYVALNTNKTYRWSGSTYVEIAQGLALGETSSTAFAGDRGKAIEDKIPSNASTSNKLATASEAVPAGGTTGQVLTKHSDADNDVEWADPQGGGGTATDVQVNGTSITSNNVANIVTNTAYNASSNKIATMSDLPSVPVTDVTVGGTSVVSSGTAVIPAIPDVSNYVQKSQTVGLLKNDGTVDTTSYGTYSKPSGGIPASDLASGVIPSVPVTDVTVGGTSVVSSGTAVIPAIPDVTGKADKVSSATSGNFAALDSNGNLTDSGHKHSDYLTSHQDISGKEDKTNKVTSLSSSSTDTQYPSAKVVYDQLATKQATLVSGTNIKTVNNTSLLGSGNIQINDGVGFQTITTQQDGTMVITLTNGDTITVDLNHQHPNYYSKVAETTQPSGGMLPDVTYKLGTLTGATTFSFAAAVSGNVNHYYFTFASGSTAVVPTWPASITSWDGNCVDSTTGLPVIAASKTYEVSVIDGNAIIKEW